MRGKSKHNGSGGRRANASGMRSSSGRSSFRPTSRSSSRKDEPEMLNQEQLTNLVYEALETELGGVEVYETALECVQNDDLREEFEKYHEETQRHVELVKEVCETLSLDPGE